MKMNENSLFALLLRSAWWVSALVAAAIIAAARLLLPEGYEIYAVFAALPFIVIALYVGWKQLRAPSAATIAKRVEKVRAMSWDEFANALDQAFGRDGYEVERLAAGPADFELVKGWKKSLVACKRWKATRTGTEPLRELEQARKKREAFEAIYIATGEVTEQARAFAKEKHVRLIEAAELVRLIGESSIARSA